jgi:bla regulator protein blaR1
VTIADLQTLLREMVVYGSAAILVVLILRQPLRHTFGSGAAYLLWLLVPLSLIAALLPAVTVLPMIVAPHNPLGTAASALGLAGPQSAAPVVSWVVFSIWVIGALSTALLLVWRQLRFVRSLGRLTAYGGMYVAEQCAGLPAVIGILRPRIVLPADHAVRFDATQQQLVREHEQMHIQHGDQISNLFALVLRTLLWFNPLVYMAVPRFRQDQELACDARVIARNPEGRRAYGEALICAQLLPDGFCTSAQGEDRHVETASAHTDSPHDRVRSRAVARDRGGIRRQRGAGGSERNRQPREGDLQAGVPALSRGGADAPPFRPRGNTRCVQ